MAQDHSPAPWVIRLAAHGTWNGAAIKSGEVRVAALTRQADKPIQVKAADGRLIAAAPKLLAALEYARGIVGDDEVIDAAISEARHGANW